MRNFDPLIAVVRRKERLRATEGAKVMRKLWMIGHKVALPLVVIVCWKSGYIDAIFIYKYKRHLNSCCEQLVDLSIWYWNLPYWFHENRTSGRCHSDSILIWLDRHCPPTQPIWWVLIQAKLIFEQYHDNDNWKNNGEREKSDVFSFVSALSSQLKDRERRKRTRLNKLKWYGIWHRSASSRKSFTQASTIT